MLYVDSSIRFKSGEVRPIVNACKNVGLLTQYIGNSAIKSNRKFHVAQILKQVSCQKKTKKALKLNCYTNPKMFDWFNETADSYEDFFTIEANILMFHRSFLTSLIMKAWVTCALDVDCIAPVGSKTMGWFEF